MAEFRGQPLYSCRNCKNPIALRDDLLSKNYKRPLTQEEDPKSDHKYCVNGYSVVAAKSGEAYLFSHAMNIIVGKNEDKQLITGLYTIADIFCSNCGEVMGWKYLRAYDARQKNKEGKFIIERAKIAKLY